MDAGARFSDLLELERNAALAADLALLEELQEKKRGIVDELAGAGLPAAELDALFKSARRNLALLRNLVDIHRELAGANRPSTYDASGRSAHATMQTRRLKVTT